MITTVKSETIAAALAYFAENYQGGSLASREAVGCLAQIEAASRPMQKARSLLAGCRRKPTKRAAARPQTVQEVQEVPEEEPFEPSLAQALAAPMSLMTLGQIKTAWARERGGELPGLIKYRLEVALEEDDPKLWAKRIKEVWSASLPAAA